MLKYSDKKVLDLINTKTKVFTELIETDGLKDGTKWDDVILKIEWLESFWKLADKYHDRPEVLSVISNEEVKFSFNGEVVEKWVSTG